jgi:TP901-1 family phage major tail protein
MAAFSGRHVRIALGSGSGAVNIAGARTDGITFNREHIDITDKDDAGVRQFLDEIGVWAVDMTVSGIIKDGTLKDWAADPTEVLKTLTVAISDLGTYTGSFGMTSFEIGAETADGTTFSASFGSSGPLTQVS